MLAIFEYRNTDQIILGVTQRLTAISTDRNTFDQNDQEAVMPHKLSVANEHLP